MDTDAAAGPKSDSCGDAVRATPGPLRWAVPAYLTLIAVGAALLGFGGTRAGGELSADRALFAAVNAGTLTGFAYEIGPEGFNVQGQLAVLALTTGATLLLLVVGGMAVVRAVGLAYTDRQVARCALFLLGVATFGGTAALLSPDRDLIPAMILAIGSLGNGGLAAGPVPDPASWPVQVVMLPLSVIGGLGVAVVLEVVDRVRVRRCLSPHAQAALALTAAAYLVATGILWLLGTGERGMLGASTLAVNARTLGLPLDFAGQWPRAGQWIAVLLMIVGATAGGTGSGVKVTTLAALTTGVRRALRGAVAGRATGIAAVWVATYAAVVTVTLVLLLIAQPETPAERAVFLAVSATSNVGLSHDTLAITGPGLHVLSAAMLAGRLLPLLVLWWVVRTGERARYGVG